MKSTTTISRLELGNLSYPVFVILDGVDRFEDANGAVTLHITDRTIIARYANGMEVEYRIDPSGRQIPKDEPSTGELDADLPIDLALTERGRVAIGGAW